MDPSKYKMMIISLICDVQQSSESSEVRTTTGYSDIFCIISHFLIFSFSHFNFRTSYTVLCTVVYDRLAPGAASGVSHIRCSGGTQLHEVEQV